MIFDVEETYAVILAYPNLMVRAELFFWLTDVVGIPRDRFIIHTGNSNCQCVGWNMSVKIALNSPGNHFIFCENDIRPHPTKTQPFLDTPADVMGVKFDNGNYHSWHHSDEMHLALWRTSRKVLESIKPPWFSRKLDEFGGEVGCFCQPFNQRLIEAGYKVKNCGWADHTPKGHQGHTT